MQLTFKKWVNSAIVTSLENHPHLKSKKHNGLSIIYNNKDIIYIVDSGFYIDSNTFSTELAEAEEMLWEKINKL